MLRFIIILYFTLFYKILSIHFLAYFVTIAHNTLHDYPKSAELPHVYLIFYDQQSIYDPLHPHRSFKKTRHYARFFTISLIVYAIRYLSPPIEC